MKNVFCEHCGTIFAAEPDSPCRCSCCGAEYTSEYISTLLSEIGPEQALFFDPPASDASPYAAEKELSVRNTDPDLIPELQKVPTIAGKTAARKHKSAVLAETSANAVAPKVSETEVSACPRPQKKDNFKTLIITLLSIAGVCLIVAGILLYGKVSKPKKSYKEAQTLLESGKYEAAIKAFTAIGGYEDSATRLLECHYLYGMEALSKGDYDLAVTELHKAGSYHQAKDAIPSVYYEKGLAFLVKEDYDGARSAFQSAGEYADAAERLTECTYLQAGSLRKNASYEAAAKLYLSLGSYSNSADLAKACYYERGMQLLQTGSYELAISTFRSAGSYQDAADKILESYYAWGEYYLKAELYDNAEKAFRSAGSYKDAATRISECRYRNALKLKDSGQFDRAIEILAALGGYEESTKQIADCHYQKALKLIEGGYFNQALAELSELDDHDDAAELVKQCNYEIGKNLYETESYEEAMQAFLTAGNYKDAEQWAKKCRAARIRCYGAIITAAEKDAFSVSGNTYSGNGFLYDMDGDGVEELVLVYRSSALADEQNTVCTAYTVDEHGNPVMLWDAKPLVGTTTKASGVSLCRVEGTLYLAIRYEKETTETITIQDDSGLLAGLWGEFSSHEESRTTTTVEWTLYAFENSSLSYYASAGGRQTVDSSGAVVAGDGHTPNGGSGWNSFQNWLSKTEILYGAGPDESHSYNKNRLNMNELLEKCS